MALNRKIAFIDLTAGTIDIRPVPLELRKKFLGGRGLDVFLLYHLLKPNVDALSPDNVCIISAGMLVGTPASASSRTHICAKSPLTGFLGSSSGGGFFAPELRFAGFDHLVLFGKAPQPSYLFVHNNEIEIRDAAAIWGKTVKESQQALRDELGDTEVKAMVIGPAGEKLVRFANVMTGLKNSCGRTGMGAVLGSKNVKAIAARGTLDVTLAHPKEALDYGREFMTQVTGSKVSQTQGRLGTPSIFSATNTQGLVNAYNSLYGQMENSDAVEVEAIDEYVTGMAACYGCGVHCRSKFIIPEGPYKGTYGEGPEYTHQVSFGSIVGCRDTVGILEGTHLTNTFGIDVLEVGNMIAWAMECFEEGILTTEDTGGLELRWGNIDAVLELTRQIGERRGFGDILAEGGFRAARILGRNTLDHFVHVKGMGQMNSDEKATPALALNIATASRGCDHLRSRPAIDLYHLPEPVLRKIFSQPVPYDGPLTSDYRDYEGKPWEVFWQENTFMAVDCLGICKFHTTFMGATHPNFEEWSKLIRLITGIELTPKDIWDCAERANNIERLFNLREGLTREDDWLVDRYFDRPNERGIPAVKGMCLDRTKFRAMIDEFYRYHGWDENGNIKPETLERLGLNDSESILERLGLDFTPAGCAGHQSETAVTVS
ncbi:MAG: aldehyde ferredoxin oxidoreductase family protein [Dehalococcoidales bacterium]|nr:aldehyde ferredoxin oxidoreductase family protein [Dehalococcoidales bacterium]